MARASAAVAAADSAAVAAVLADFPDAAEIGSDFSGGERAPRLSLPADPAKRAQYLREEIERLRLSVCRDVSAYSLLRVDGLRALSDYEICSSPGGCPVAALRAALALRHGRISSGLTMGHCLRLELADALRALGKPPQLTLF